MHRSGSQRDAQFPRKVVRSVMAGHPYRCDSDSTKSKQPISHHSSRPHPSKLSRPLLHPPNLSLPLRHRHRTPLLRLSRSIQPLNRPPLRWKSLPTSSSFCHSISPSSKHISSNRLYCGNRPRLKTPPRPGWKIHASRIFPLRHAASGG